MSDTNTTTSQQNSGRFVKGGPGGPGRPRGSANRDTLLRDEIQREAVRTRALIVACLRPRSLAQRLDAFEADLRLRDTPRKASKHRFSTVFHRFLARAKRKNHVVSGT